MIRVRIELVPGGIEEAAREIARMEIANIGQDDNGNYTYGFTASAEPNSVSGEDRKTFNGVVRNHDRKQSIFVLVHRAARIIADRIKHVPIPSGLSQRRESA